MNETARDYTETSAVLKHGHVADLLCQPDRGDANSKPSTKTIHAGDMLWQKADLIFHHVGRQDRASLHF